ncbi:MAG: signal peptidase II [Dehalococcoidales bacterium]|nr:signal peptidase II [Dehalococcoidales bacterium]
MEKLRPARDKWRDIIFCSVVVFVVIADQVTKALIRASLLPGEVFVDFGFFQIDHIQNTGASFGILKGYSLLIIVIAIIGVLVIMYLALFMRNRIAFLRNNWVIVSMAMVTAGTIGNNLIDRIRQGHVTDFLDFKIWPAFNVADMCTVVGAIIIAYRLIFYSGLFKSKDD